MPYGRSEKDLLTAWEDLPYVNGEDGKAWNNLMAKFQHTGCPGIDYEDICMHDATECAVKGVCKYLHEKQQKEWIKHLNNK
jgi:hypothetical protein